MKNYYTNKISNYDKCPSEHELNKHVLNTDRLRGLRKKNLEKIYKNISITIKKIFGDDLLRKAHEGKLLPSDSVKANVDLAKAIYSEGLTDIIQNGDLKQFEDLSEDNFRKFTSQKKSSLSSFLVLKGVFLLIVRPEMYHLYLEIENYLKKERIKIIASMDRRLSFKQYWAMYKENLADKNAFSDFPTRTLVYLSGKCRIIVFLKPSAVNLSKIKGERGVYIPQTIRGDLVTRESLYLMGGGAVDIEKLYFTLDPIGCYRSIITGGIPSDKIHKNYKYPFFFYAIAGIHMPESDETQREMQVLLSLNELQEVTKRVLSVELEKRVGPLSFKNSGESIVYSVDIEGERNYLKIRKGDRENNSFVFEAQTLNCLHNLGAKVSKPIEYGDNYLLQSEIQGESINDRPKLFLNKRIYDELVEDLNRFYSLDFIGFGRVGANNKKKAEYDNWEDFFNEVDVWVEEINKKALADRSLIDSLYENWTCNKKMIAGVDRAHLVHGDFCLDHIYSYKRHYSGIIDFGDAFAGDPLMDLAYFRYKEITKSYGSRTYELLVNAYSKFRKFEEGERGLISLYMIYWGFRRVYEMRNDSHLSKFVDKLEKLEAEIINQN